MYNPATTPDSDTWLALDESERIAMITAWHEENATPALHPPGENPRLHATLHAVVETQIAGAHPPVARQTVERLMGESVQRHAVLHAVMEVLILHMHAAITGGEFDELSYATELHALDAPSIVARGLRRMRMSEAE